MPIDRKVHTERLLLIDRNGVRRGIFSTGDPAQMLALKKGVDKLLAETPEPVAEKPRSQAEAAPAKADVGAKERS
jgi:hypothetical protein